MPIASPFGAFAGGLTQALSPFLAQRFAATRARENRDYQRAQAAEQRQFMAAQQEKQIASREMMAKLRTGAETKRAKTLMEARETIAREIAGPAPDPQIPAQPVPPGPPAEGLEAFIQRHEPLGQRLTEQFRAQGAPVGGAGFWPSIARPQQQAFAEQAGLGGMVRAAKGREISRLQDVWEKRIAGKQSLYDTAVAGRKKAQKEGKAAVAAYEQRVQTARQMLVLGVSPARIKEAFAPPAKAAPKITTAVMRPFEGKNREDLEAWLVTPTGLLALQTAAEASQMTPQQFAAILRTRAP